MTSPCVDGWTRTFPTVNPAGMDATRTFPGLVVQVLLQSLPASNEYVYLCSSPPCRKDKAIAKKGRQWCFKGKPNIDTNKFHGLDYFRKMALTSVWYIGWILWCMNNLTNHKLTKTQSSYGQFRNLAEFRKQVILPIRERNRKQQFGGNNHGTSRSVQSAISFKS